MRVYLPVDVTVQEVVVQLCCQPVISQEEFKNHLEDNVNDLMMAMYLRIINLPEYANFYPSVKEYSNFLVKMKQNDLDDPILITKRVISEAVTDILMTEDPSASACAGKKCRHVKGWKNILATKPKWTDYNAKIVTVRYPDYKVDSIKKNEGYWVLKLGSLTKQH